MKAKEYKVLIEAVEQGVNYGITRILKYRTSDQPLTESELRAKGDEIAEYVTSSILEWFDFDDTHKDESL